MTLERSKALVRLFGMLITSHNEMTTSKQNNDDDELTTSTKRINRKLETPDLVCIIVVPDIDMGLPLELWGRARTTENLALDLIHRNLPSTNLLLSDLVEQNLFLCRMVQSNEQCG